jgi:hypothetical protein
MTQVIFIVCNHILQVDGLHQSESEAKKFLAL